ncbi:MAG: hypothetical protein K6A65_03400, partial [Succinivibrionaceae bacterium]|nr:hypothetical protein [Succinivibrionaceae bacterium]
MPVLGGDTVTMTREEYARSLAAAPLGGLLAEAASVAGADCEAISSLRDAVAAGSVSLLGEAAALRAELGRYRLAFSRMAGSVRDAGLAAPDCTCLRPSEVPDPASAGDGELCEWAGRLCSAALSLYQQNSWLRKRVFGSHPQEPAGPGPRPPRRRAG